MFRRLSSVDTVCRSIFAASAKYRVPRAPGPAEPLFFIYRVRIENIPKIHLQMGNTEKIEAQGASYYSSKPIIQSTQPISGFSPMIQQCFVDTVSQTPIFRRKYLGGNLGTRHFVT
jgi:hypothetical protein